MQYYNNATKILLVLFKKVLINYFQEMKDKINPTDYESMAMMFISMNFGFIFLDASFGRKLTQLEKRDYISNAVRIFVDGISKK